MNLDKLDLPSFRKEQVNKVIESLTPIFDCDIGECVIKITKDKEHHIEMFITKLRNGKMFVRYKTIYSNEIEE